MTCYSECQMRILEKERIKCRDVLKLYGDHIENELPVTLRARVDAHIADCPECQEFTKSYNEVIALARELPQISVPEAVSRRLRDRLNKEFGINL